MPSLVISIDGAIFKEVALTKQRTTIGRRPYNDIVINHPAVSGEHALLHCVDGSVSVEDLQSTNGSYVNQQRITRQQLQAGDVLNIGRYQLRLQLSTQESAALDTAHPAARGAYLLLLDIPGHQLPLVKTVTTLGKPGQAVAAITRQATGFTLTQIEGPKDSLRLNGLSLGAEPQPLQHGDRLELAGSHLQFLLQAAT